MAEFICKPCQNAECDDCTDILKVITGMPLVCKCKLVGHSGEPRDKQILDPTTGDVYAPGLRVLEDGTVQYSE